MPSAKGHALVTGGSRGIGRAVVERLAHAGYDVSFCSRTADDHASSTSKTAEQYGVAVWPATCDVRDPDAVKEFVAEAERRLGPPRVVVTSAGITRDRPLAMMPAASWQDVVDTNLGGTYHVCRAVIGGMYRRRDGVIVALSSVAGVYGNAGQVNYSASKAGINGLVRALAKESAGFGVRVNAIAPGFIDTDMTAALPEKAYRAALERIPMRRFGRADAVADLAVYLASEAGDYITGQVLQIDGGLVL